MLAVSGDFDRDAMVAKLEKLFSDQNTEGVINPKIPTNTVFAAPGAYLINKPDVNQGRVDMMLPGITVDTSSEDHRVIKKLQLERFDGTRWVMFGGVLGD